MASFPVHKVFISYHHANDQTCKETLLRLNQTHRIFIDASVDTGDINDELSDESIRQKIRNEYLRDSTVTIVLVGLETKKRKHVDWEIYSSMFNGTVNKQSGVLVINLPSTGCTSYHAAHGDKEKQTVYPDNSSWTNITSRAEYNQRYPYMPDRIIDNLLKSGVLISISNWDRITEDISKLRFLINATFDDKARCEYDLSSPMRRSNS